MIRMPEINQEKCNLCGLCAAVCECNALVIVNNRLQVIETEACGWCTLCEAVCPTNALTCPFEILIEES